MDYGPEQSTTTKQVGTYMCVLMRVHVCTYVHRTCIRVLKFIHNYVLVHVHPHVIPPSDVLWAHNWEFDAIKFHGAHESHLKY